MIKTLRKFNALLTALVLALSALTVFVPGRAEAATVVWDGGAGNGLFSHDANWVGNAVPQAGDIISFNTYPETTEQLTNDLGFALGGVVSEIAEAPEGAYGGYVIDTIEVEDGASLVGEPYTTCDQKKPGIQISELESAGDVIIGDGVSFYWDEPVVNVDGVLTLKGINGLHAGSGSSIGSVVLEPGSISALNCGGFGGGPASGSNFSGFTMNSLTVRKGASTLLANVDFPLVLGGGSGTGNPLISFYGDLDEEYEPVDTEYIISGAITLSGDANFFVGSKTTVKITGTINGAGHSINRLETSQGQLINNSSNDNSDTPSGAQENQPKETKHEGDQPNTHVTIVDKETATLLGVRGSVTVMGGGILKGTGTATYLTLYEGAKVAPGLSPGTITVLNSLSLTEGSEFEAEVLNKDSYDKFIVGEELSSGDAVLLDNATLNLWIPEGFAIEQDDTFMIIDNRQGAVNGIFKDLPEGATFKAGGESNGVFKITYVGGDGNDVVLSVVTVPTVPSTGFFLGLSSPYVVLAFTIASAAAAFYLARRFAFAAAKK